MFKFQYMIINNINKLIFLPPDFLILPLHKTSKTYIYIRQKALISHPATQCFSLCSVEFLENQENILTNFSVSATNSHMFSDRPRALLEYSYEAIRSLVWSFCAIADKMSIRSSRC